MGWKKFEGGIVPEGYEIMLFPHCGLMIRKKFVDIKLIFVDK